MRFPLLLAGLCLVATGCFDTDEESSATTPATTSAVTSGTTAPSTEPAVTAVPATTAAATDPTPTTVEAADTPSTTEAPEVAPPATDPVESPPTDDCLVGAWVISQDEMNGFYDAVEANIEGGAIDFEIVGQTLLTFTETDYAYEPAFELSLTIAGQEGSGVASGSVSGTYTTADGVITTTLGSSDMQMDLTVGGVTMDASSIGNSFIASVPINDAPYSCATGVPVIDFETGDGTPRHPVTLAPAG